MSDAVWALGVGIISAIGGLIVGNFAGRSQGIAELLKKDTYCESTKVQGKEFKRCWAITELDQ